jgi:HSP20 family molecular chaperone IbpA
MIPRGAALLAAVLPLSACALFFHDHNDPKGVPPPVHEDISWESFIHEPWADPLHENYEELFGAPFPNPGRQHFDADRPFSDVAKYDLAFNQAAVPGARSETESGGGEYAVALRLPQSADKDVEVSTDEESIRLTATRPGETGRYRANRPEETVVPLPAGADPSTARVERDGDWIRVKFRGKKPGRPHGK